MDFIPRILERSVKDSLENNPVAAIIGPRQCGKSTLARKIIRDLDCDTVFLDLERPSDLSKLNDPELFLKSQRDKLICLDEIQRKPELFPLIRSLVDEWGGSQHFLILGSASIDLLKQSSESMAGRISYNTLYPFAFDEIIGRVSFENYMLRGGYPRSILANSDAISRKWIQDLVMTYVERDLLQWSGVSSTTMHRLWKMLAHLNGQVINHSNLSNSLDVSSVTIKNYLDLLENTFMIRVIPPYLPNIGKRLIKSPKVYVHDVGVLCGLLDISNYEQLLGHPVFGSLWELIVLNQIKTIIPSAKVSHFRTSHGHELDFILEIGNKTVAIECKSSLSPKLTKGNRQSIENIDPDLTLVVCPVNDQYPIHENIDVVGLSQLSKILV